MAWERLLMKRIAEWVIAGWMLCLCVLAAGCHVQDSDATGRPQPVSHAQSSTPPQLSTPAQQTTNPPQAPAHTAQQPSAQPPSLLGAPPVEFVPSSLDLGTLKPSANAFGTIMMHNLSDKPLLIKATRASCTCTALNLANTTIPPGQAMPLDVSYHASSIMGPKTASIRILFDGYDLVEVPVTATVSLPVRSEPAHIDALKNANGEQTLSGQFTVYALDQKSFRVLAVNGKPPAFINFDPAEDTPRTSYILQWDLTGYDQGTCKNAAGERFPRWIIVETDHPEGAIFDLEVRHECNVRKRPTPMDEWVISDKRLLAGAMKPGEPIEVDAQINWIAGRTRESPPSAVVSESGQFTAEWVSVQEGEDGLLLRMRITPSKDAKGLIYGTVRVHSNRQSAPVFVIGAVRPPSDAH